MTKPLFTITFTQEQAIDFIKQQIKDNYSSLDDFDVVIKNDADVVIQQKTIPNFSGISGGEISTKSEAETHVNPWLVPDEYGWFTHYSTYAHVETPPYIDKSKIVSLMFRDGRIIDESFPTYADWSQENNCDDIIKWKYVD